MQQPTEAEAAYREAIRLRPTEVDAHANLGLLLQQGHRFAEAEAALRQAIALQPDYAEVYVNLGVLLQTIHRPAEAEATYWQAIRLQPECAEAHYNLGAFLQGQHRLAEAEAAYQHAIRSQPDHAEACWNLSLLYLSLGRFQEGWPLHEARHHPNKREQRVVPLAVPFPRWNGEPLPGHSLLLVAEQGLGDQIQFCRYAAHLKARGVRWLTLVCAAPLAALFASLAGVDQVLVPSTSHDYPAHDYWAFYLAIPLHLATTLATIPQEIPYLRAPADRLAVWERGLPPADFRVGLVWKGNLNNKKGTDRSLPALTVLAPLWSVPGVAFVSLQKGDGEAEASQPPPDQPLFHPGAAIQDFADTAAIVTHLDLVISIDSAVAHLAGALGKPCWVLLPARETDWRWLQGRADSPWYPGVMRLFRQKRPEEWSAVVEEVRAALVVLVCMSQEDHDLARPGHAPARPENQPACRDL
ncbi:MAG: tetratricopeptide repeat protein [Magnetococcales bacterium]|nr:tetratricopeptide repeat protein [Magnetococcales bacterium]